MNKKGNYVQQGDRIATTIEGTEIGFEELSLPIQKYIEDRIKQGYDHGPFVEVQFPSESNMDKELKELNVRQTEIKVLIANELFTSYSERDFLQCESDQIDEIMKYANNTDLIQVGLKKQETELVLKGLELLVNNFEQLKTLLNDHEAHKDIDNKVNDIMSLMKKINTK